MGADPEVGRDCFQSKETADASFNGADPEVGRDCFQSKETADASFNGADSEVGRIELASRITVGDRPGERLQGSSRIFITI